MATPPSTPGTTSPPWTTCKPCRSIFTNFPSLQQAFTSQGHKHTTTRQTFRTSISQRCGLCTAFHNLANQGNLEAIKAQALFDPEDLDGVDEADYASLEPFRVQLCSGEEDEMIGRGKEELVWNVWFEVMPGRARYDATSVWIAAWDAENRFHLGLEFDVWADEDDPAGMFVRTRPRNPNVSSDASFSLARKWIADCTSTHDICPKPKMVLPSRVIDVETNGEFCQLQRGEDVGQSYYAALSYVWGGPQPVTLTRAALLSMFSEIKIASLPQTIQDAVTTTRKLGLRYLWVDAMCIIQDDDADKNCEIARMDEIYHNAYVTICAACATKCQDGFLEDKHSEFPGVYPRARSKIAFPCPNRRVGEIELTVTQTYDPIMEPINSRAWCYQERLLSPRVLTYGSWQMYWQCQSKQYCDGGEISRFEQAGTERLSMFAFETSPSGCQPQSTDQQSISRRNETIHANWQSIVQEYNLRDVTDPQDKLSALAGIAKQYGEALSGDKYCAGLWESQFVPTLVWQNGYPKPTRPESYRAPTWSWASVDGEVFWAQDALSVTIAGSMLARVTQCQVTPATAETVYGRVQSGRLTIEGTARAMDWDGTLHQSKDGAGWSIHPDIFSGEHIPGLTNFDNVFDDISDGQENIKYDVTSHLSLGQNLPPGSSASGEKSASTLSVLCMRITDIAALVLELDQSASTAKPLESPPTKRRKVSSGDPDLSGSNTVLDTEKISTHRRIGLLVFEGPDGIDDADQFFQSAFKQTVTIV